MYIKRRPLHILVCLQSDEILSFFIYILKDLGLKDVPTLAKIKAFWFQNLKLEDMIQQVKT